MTIGESIIFIPIKFAESEILEIFRVSSESKNWDANHHPWVRLDSSFLSTHTKAISGTGSVKSNFLVHLSIYVKYFIYNVSR